MHFASNVFFSLLLLCAVGTHAALATPDRKLAGAVAYADGTPAADASISLADPATGKFADVVIADRAGHFKADVNDGDYALAVAAPDGFAWLAKQHSPADDLAVTLSRTCIRVTGHIDGAPASARVHILHNSHNVGEVYSAPISRTGQVTFCLPNGTYRASLGEGALAKEVELDVASPASFRLRGFATADVKRGIPPVRGVHAESLLLQLAYWDGDMPSWYARRRDVVMAEISKFIIQHTGTPRAVVWAHDGHVDKDPANAGLGANLAKMFPGYWAVGFYMHQGSTRAWDAEGTEIGAHPLPPAAPFTVEDVVMKSTGGPDVAWVDLHRMPRTLKRWLNVPRYVREAGAIYRNDDETWTLYKVSASFDAVVVIKRGTDSTPSALVKRPVP